VKRYAVALLAAAALATACWSAGHQTRYERAAVRLVQGIRKHHVNVTAVSCSHIHGNAAHCVLRDSAGTDYSCDIQVGPATFAQDACEASGTGRFP
jgi:predicted hotdog family 3-hydroxylacyl-ACP dehydratase